jgi:hypothetical protein
MLSFLPTSIEQFCLLITLRRLRLSFCFVWWQPMLRLLPHDMGTHHHPLRHITIDLHNLINHCTIIHIAINQVDVAQPMALLVVFLEILPRIGRPIKINTIH